MCSSWPVVSLVYLGEIWNSGCYKWISLLWCSLSPGGGHFSGFSWMAPCPQVTCSGNRAADWPSMCLWRTGASQQERQHRGTPEVASLKSSLLRGDPAPPHPCFPSISLLSAPSLLLEAHFLEASALVKLLPHYDTGGGVSSQKILPDARCHCGCVCNSLRGELGDGAVEWTEGVWEATAEPM